MRLSGLVVGFLFLSMARIQPQILSPLVGGGIQHLATPVPVQQQTNSVNGATFNQVTFPVPPSAGHTLVACFVYRNTLTFSAMQAQTNVTWTTVIVNQSTGTGGAGNSRIGLTFGTVTGTASTISRVNFTGTTSGSVLNVAEFNFPNNGVDGTPTASQGTGGTPTSAAYTTTGATDMVTPCLGLDTTTTPAIVTYVPLTSVNNGANSIGMSWGFKFPVAPGAQSATWGSTAATWATIIAGFLHT